MAKIFQAGKDGILPISDQYGKNGLFPGTPVQKYGDEFMRGKAALRAG